MASNSTDKSERPQYLLNSLELESSQDIERVKTNDSGRFEVQRLSAPDPEFNTTLEKGEVGNSELMTSFLMLNAMIGSGILNQPQVFQASGIGAALILFTVAAGFIWLSLVVLIECGIARGKFDYSELSKAIFGDMGETLVDVAIVLGNFGALISYLDVIGGTSSDLFYSWGCQSSGCSPYVTTPILVFIYVLPVCSLRYFGHLAWYSLFSMVAIGSCLGLVVIAGPIVGNGGPVVGFKSGCGSQLGSIVFTLGCAFAAFHSYKAMKEPTIEKWRRVARNSVLVGYFLACSMGVAGYLSFGNAVDGVILDNFVGHYADFFKVLLVLHLVLYIPVEFMVMRHSIVKIGGIKSGSIKSYAGHLALTLALLFVGCLVILLLRRAGYSQGNAFSIVLNFTGAITGSLISFILPGIYYINLHQKTEKYFYPCCLMAVFGFCIMIISPVLSVLSLE